MARCAYCNQTILFGGRAVGEHQYCSTHHALLGRSVAQVDAQSNLAGLRETVQELREDLLTLAAEVQQQGALLAETNERLDFLERAVVQLRDAAQKSARSP